MTEPLLKVRNLKIGATVYPPDAKPHDIEIVHGVDFEVLPGKVLDVHYEETVTDLDSQVRRILDHCGLPFEEQCLRFWETDRAVRTASSEQVRQPIYTGALGKWRRYEAHLDLWKEQLSDILDELPEVVTNAGV